MPHSSVSTPASTTTEPCPQDALPSKKQFWNNNLPESQWTGECPDFLLGISQKNVDILSSREEDYRVLTWSDTRELVETNRIDQFQRSPLELRRYLQYMYKLKQNYGSVLSFVQQERLHWDSVTPSAEPPFTNPSDFRILHNDWPYGINQEITHLVVWTKFPLKDDPDTGLLTAEHDQLIADFVTNTFCGEGEDCIDGERVIWFRNWKSLKSVHSLEHFHVMLYRAPQEFLKRITNDDKPMSELVGVQEGQR